MIDTWPNLTEQLATASCQLCKGTRVWSTSGFSFNIERWRWEYQHRKQPCGRCWRDPGFEPVEADARAKRLAQEAGL